jgi:hypothetical protein
MQEMPGKMVLPRGIEPPTYALPKHFSAEKLAVFLGFFSSVSPIYT